jgi:hypothetical protein
MIDIDRSWGVAGTFVHGGTETEIGKHPDPIPSRATVFEQLRDSKTKQTRIIRISLAVKIWTRLYTFRPQATYISNLK